MAANQTSAQKQTWLTQDAYDRLKGELDQLSGEGRRDIIERIAAARDEGDLKENGGYHAAREQQGKMEARIRDIEEMLKHAVVGEAPVANGVVEVGTLITAEIWGDEERFLLGNRELADGSDLDVYSAESPLGVAILGLKVGDSASYAAPNGKQIDVKILAVDTYAG
ncbi:MAG: transcription elongation factor GreA [Actinobacteria bacterium]|nr:transcription elongation factor GreA [Actinomycetota bacterium]